MRTEKCLALMFYDKDNHLVGSVGLPEDASDEMIESAMEQALMDVFSVEEYEKIAYAKVEEHFLIFK